MWHSCEILFKIGLEKKKRSVDVLRCGDVRERKVRKERGIELNRIDLN
jgi:hypothetical protein